MRRLALTLFALLVFTNAVWFIAYGMLEIEYVETAVQVVRLTTGVK